MSTSESKSYHHGDLRTALVDSALAILAEDGADALTLRGVARRAGVSAMAPYRHYPDKTALLAAVAGRGFEALRDALAEADAKAPPGQALAAQGIAYVRFALAHPVMFRLMFGPVQSTVDSELKTKGHSAYSVLANRVSLETPEPLREARVLGCWGLVHGLAGLALDGLIGPVGPAIEAAVTAAILALCPATAQAL
jgi:AcrR family transcriptional regulator